VKGVGPPTEPVVWAGWPTGPCPKVVVGVVEVGVVDVDIDVDDDDDDDESPDGNELVVEEDEEV
jgi:hypothetical protein